MREVVPFSMYSGKEVTVVGGGLAGTECAYQLARFGHRIALREQKPLRRSSAHQTDALAELVCSNSMRSDSPESAIGMLHGELRRVGSLILACADATRVPAGAALAVDRQRFATVVRERLLHSASLRLLEGEVTHIPQGVTIIATGPLTSSALATALEPLVGKALYFYDAIAPIVAADSIDRSLAFLANRWAKGAAGDYLNLPMSKDAYVAFVRAVRGGTKVTPHAFEEPKYFEGCLPIEIMAERGDSVLAFGPMKPIGLVDPRTGRRPYAIVQLRREDVAGTAWNLVGFQTRLTHSEQKRIFAMIPGLQRAEWLRMGQIHRNTFIDSPSLLARDLSLKTHPHIFFAGQITGVDGYVESAACGYLAALAVHARMTGMAFVPPPASTALGALHRHITGEAHPQGYTFQPSNIIFSLFPPLSNPVKKADRRMYYARRARIAFDAWAPFAPESVAPQSAATRTHPYVYEGNSW